MDNPSVTPTGIERYFAEQEERSKRLAAERLLKAQEIKKRAFQPEIAVLNARLIPLKQRLEAKKIALDAKRIELQRAFQISLCAELAPLDMEISEMEERIRALKKAAVLSSSLGYFGQ